MKTNSSIKLGLVAALPLALAACGGGGGGTSSASSTATTTTPTATFQSKAGTAFAADFNADPNGTPPHPAATDVPALNLSAEPFTK